MNLLQDLQQNTLHHAYALSGQGEAFITSLFKIFQEGGITTQGNPDFIYKKFESVGIDESRELKLEASQKSFTTGKKIFVIESGFLTREAQNALLKLFEEPIVHTHFFLVLPDIQQLLSTLLSRIIVITGEKSEESTVEVIKFLQMSYKDRLAYIKKKTDKKGDGEETMGKKEILSFVNGLEKILYTKSKERESLKNLAKVRSYLHDQGASVKMILEHIALVVPQL